MTKKSNLNNADANYQVLEWDAGSFAECCRTIIANSNQHIHRIKLNKKEEVYLVPKEFYLAAKEYFKRSRGGSGRL